MRTEELKFNPTGWLLAVARSVAYGVVVATGVLTIVFAIAAAVRGSSLGDLYVEVFPRFRGGGHVSDIPLLAYAIFFAYVIAAAELAILHRRRLARRSKQR